MAMASSREEEISKMEELDRLIDERLTVIKSKLIPSYRSALNQWQNTLTVMGEWFQTRTEEFIEYTDELCVQYSRGQEGAPVVEDRQYESRNSHHMYKPHHCDKGCWPRHKVRDSGWHKYSPLCVPIRLGWQRVCMQRGGDGKLDICYIAPCGRRLRSMEEVQQFLVVTDIHTLKLSHFTYDHQTSIQSVPFDPRAEGANMYIPDISKGAEVRPISCVNTVTSEFPPDLGNFTYMTTRSHEPGISLHTEREFLLTLQEAQVVKGGGHSVGFVHGRMNHMQHAAIYECNQWCSCGPRCANRVVQNGLQHRLQVYKTNDMGWGLRTLDDIPAGSFICTYIGHIYTEQGGEENAACYGDEYCAELDYIEVMEHHKEGYESDVDDRMSEYSSTSSSSSSVGGPKYVIKSIGPTTIKLSRSLSSPPSSGDEGEGEGEGEVEERTKTSSLSTVSTLSTPLPSPRPSTPGLSHVSPHATPIKAQGLRTRRLFNEEHSYLMDAKKYGNLGKYINHSCSPNLFVQNVFIDTHDLRFPWVAFFARKRIKAFQQLTWDYNYEVGSVVGKKIQCMCGAPNCRGRLL